MSSSISDWIDGRRAAWIQLLGLACSLGVWVIAERGGWKAPLLGILMVLWAGWFAVRAWQKPGLLQRWGIRGLQWKRQTPIYVAGTVAAVLFLVVVAVLGGRFAWPDGMWVVLLLYPAWALAQQFALQNGVVDSFRQLGWDRRLLPLVAGLAFGAAHLPDLPLAALTATGGLFWTSLWLRARNLWLLALSHAIVGTLAFVWVLGRHPADEFPTLAALL